MEQAHGTSNAQTLFGVQPIPCNNQIRHLLDATPPSQVTPMFSYLFEALNQAGVIDRYRAVNQTRLLAWIFAKGIDPLIKASSEPAGGDPVRSGRITGGLQVYWQFIEN